MARSEPATRRPWNAEHVLRLVEAGFSDREIGLWFGIKTEFVGDKICNVLVRGTGLPVVTTSRPCVVCRSAFPSVGRGHRVCDGCRKTEGWQHGSAPDHAFSGRVK